MLYKLKQTKVPVLMTELELYLGGVHDAVRH